MNFKIFRFLTVLGILTSASTVFAPLTSVDATPLRAPYSYGAPAIDYRTFPHPIGRQVVVPDALIDAAIDRRLSPAERAFMRQTLLRIPPSYRSNVVYLTADGILHVNNLDLLSDFTVDRNTQSAQPSAPSRVGAALPVVSTRSTTSAPPCTAPNIAGEKTGEFRRVIVECPGYTAQNITFSNPVCSIGQYAQFSGDSVYILGGAYTTDGGAGVDTGLQYSIAKAGYNGFFAGSIGGVVTGKNGTLPCGGLYGMATTIVPKQGDSTKNTFVLNDSYTDQSGGGGITITLMGDVLASKFSLSASNWVARRCTCLAQKTFNTSDGTWFGFSRNINGNGPNLSLPQFEYTSFTISNVQNPTGFQVDSTLAIAGRNPLNENNVVLCGHDPFWQMTNFNTYEGFNLGNPNATGQYNEVSCIG